MAKGLKNKKTPLLPLFVEWYATPPRLRPDGIYTQGDFSALHDVSEHTLTDWKHLPEFDKLVQESMEKMKTKFKNEILKNLTDICVSERKDVVSAQTLWLKYVDGWSEKITTQADSKQADQLAEALDILRSQAKP